MRDSVTPGPIATIPHSRIIDSRMKWLLLSVLVLLALAGCGNSPDPGKAASKPTPPPPMPDVYRVTLDTTNGEVVVEVHKDWAPEGAERFYTLVNQGFFDGARFYRVVRGYIVQFGYSGDPKIDSLWQSSFLPDDPVKKSNKRGFVSFAQQGKNSRTTQVFINLRDNPSLDKAGFAPFAEVVEGMDLVESIYSAYGDVPTRGSGPDPQLLGSQGNPYLTSKFPRLDYIRKATVTAAPSASEAKTP